MVNNAKEAEILKDNLKTVINMLKEAYDNKLEEHLKYEKQMEVRRYVYDLRL